MACGTRPFAGWLLFVRVRLAVRSRKQRRWIAAGFDASAFYAVRVAVSFRSGIRYEEVLALLQHADAIVDLRPFGFLRRRLHRKLGAGRVARLRHVIGRCHLLYVNRMGKTRRTQPVSRLTERVFSAARGAILLVAATDFPNFESPRKTASTALTVEALCFPCAEAFVRHDRIHGAG